MKNANKIRCLVFATLWFLVLGVPVRALDPNQPANSFLRTHFSTDNGLPGGVVNQIAQTKDGFLWLATNGRHLVRFDGKSFYEFEVLATALAIAPDGDLWVGTREGVVRIPSSNFNQFALTGSVTYHPAPGKASEINCLRFTKSGVLWIGTADGLFRYEGNQFVAIGPRVVTGKIEEAPDGHLLVRNDEGFVELAGSEVVPHPRLADQLGVKDNQIFHVLKDSHGTTWYCTALGVARETDGRIEKLGTYAPQNHAGLSTYEDDQGNIWITKDEGLFRATPARLELVSDKKKIRSIYSDRDGALWVGTDGDGLYRFKNRAVRMYTTDDGLPNNVIQTVMAAHDGAIWTGANCGGVSRYDGTNFQTFKEKDGLLNSCVWALAEDTNGDLWIGTYNGGAFRYHNGIFTQYSKTQGLVDDRVVSIIIARDGTVWFGTRGGISGLRNGVFHNFTTADGLSGTVNRIFEDRAGVIWIGTRKGLDRLVGGRIENVASVPKALVYPVGQDRDNGIYATVDAESVMFHFDKDRIDAIKELIAPYDMVETEQGELWFAGCNISRVPAGSFAHSRRRDEPLDFEAFSTDDGLNTIEVTEGGRSLALTRDGKLWAATPKGLAMFDLRRLPIANSRPSIYLTDMTIGRATQHASREVVLPPGTSHLEIDFSAVEISSPEKIRMQYRLDGVDSEWLDAAAANPHAIYSNIPVGTHSLHIRACNRNGIWDRQGVVFSIRQQPYFYQKRWFVVAMLALGIVVVGLIYRLRVGQISRRMSARFDERLAERTRVAREIHDTFLQTVQGSKMVADHALKDPADHERMVRAMGQLSTWLEQATEEGRAALNSLRASTTEKNDLAEAFRRAIDECRTESRAEISFSVTGESREMHPVVRDEIYRIGYEAIRNSCVHSGGDRIEVTLKYGHDLTSSISDNGTGIVPEVVENGKEGHFGLRGMRERAERIGSKFTLVSSPASGTVITLVVPARIAFRPVRPKWSERIKSIFNPN